MAFTATVESITPIDNNYGGLSFSVGVTFNDSATGWSTSKNYVFPITETQAAAGSVIIADGTKYKNALATISNLQNVIGTVLTI